MGKGSNLTLCGKCSSPVEDESTSAGDAAREPCQVCGSISRDFAVRGSVNAVANWTASLTIETYPEALLKVCRSLIDDGQHSVSVVVAHMACEVATERCLTAAFHEKGLDYLEEPVTEFLNGYNLSNQRTLKLYRALTGDSVEQEAFWPMFKQSVTRRNQAVHRGEIIDTAGAEASYEAACAFVEHLSIK